MKIVIIGGGAGGATAAARARRLDEQAEIIIFERGEDISVARELLGREIDAATLRDEDADLWDLAYGEDEEFEEVHA